MNSNLGLVHFWQQGDLVTHSVAILLVLLSVASWSLTITRFILQLRFNRSMERGPQAFWQARALPDALNAIEAADKTSVFAGLAKTGIHAAQVHGCPAGKNLGTGSTDCGTCAQANECHAALGLGAGVSLNECVTRALRNHILHSQARMESGLTFLASGQGGRPGRRGADHDRRWPICRHPCGARLQRADSWQSPGAGSTRRFRA
jgi:biopolymer transport protein ExbB